MTSNSTDRSGLSPLDALLLDAPRRYRDLLTQPVLRVMVKGREGRDVICRVVSTELDGRIPLDYLAGGRHDARNERSETLKIGTVIKVHYGFDADGRLIFDERKLYNDKVFAEFPVGKKVRLRISRANPALGLHLRCNFGDGRSHEVFIPRGHLKRSVSTYRVGHRMEAEVIVSQAELNGDLTIILSERASAWKRLSALSSQTTVQARYRGFKNGNHQFALFTLRGTLHPDELPKPLTAEQSTVGGFINVRVKSFIGGRLLLTRFDVQDDSLAV